jgi:hypothetical protein
MKINYLFYIYPENKIFMNELDEQEQKEVFNQLKSNK